MRIGTHIIIIFWIFCFALIVLSSCTETEDYQRPNVILIMADDMGKECLGSYGSLSYDTPILDSLAANGIQVSHCISQPLCSPSRVKIMTGLYNYRNYEAFARLPTGAYTFGNLMKDAGYETCIAGKWQLGVEFYQEQVGNKNAKLSLDHFGFDEHCLWDIPWKVKGERYANAHMLINGELKKPVEDSYGPDDYSDFICDYIDRKKDSPFFIYYPMALVHKPIVPTPDSKDWETEDMRFDEDTTYFKDMVAYTDKMVGKIIQKLKEAGVYDNTLLIFTGDNGTVWQIHSKTKDGIYRGGKGHPVVAGTHVPLIISWPEKIKKGFKYEGLIEFSDFFPTLAELVGKESKSDGISFFPLLTGEAYQPRKTAFVHYDPKTKNCCTENRNRFVRTIDYKLYLDGRFFDVSGKTHKMTRLWDGKLTEEQKKVKVMLQKELDRHPFWEID